MERNNQNVEEIQVYHRPFNSEHNILLLIEHSRQEISTNDSKVNPNNPLNVGMNFSLVYCEYRH